MVSPLRPPPVAAPVCAHGVKHRSAVREAYILLSCSSFQKPGPCRFPGCIRKHVRLSTHNRTPFDLLYSNIAVGIEVEFDLRVSLKLDDAGVAQIDHRAYLIGRLDRRTGQNCCSRYRVGSVDCDWSIPTYRENGSESLRFGRRGARTGRHPGVASGRCASFHATASPVAQLALGERHGRGRSGPGRHE